MSACLSLILFYCVVRHPVICEKRVGDKKMPVQKKVKILAALLVLSFKISSPHLFLSGDLIFVREETFFGWDGSLAIPMKICSDLSKVWF